MPPRPTPFDLVFGELAEAQFPRLASGLEQAGIDPRDRDAFLLRAETATLLRDIHPDDPLGEGIAELAALVHHAFLFWRAGNMTLPLDRASLSALLDENPERVPPGDPLVPPAFYLQLPTRQVWAELVPGDPHEPLDGVFVADAAHGGIRVLGIFGLHAELGGFTVAEAEGAAPVGLTRVDGAALFSPVLPGGAAARLHSLVGLEELLELGWRARDVACRASRAAESAARGRGEAR